MIVFIRYCKKCGKAFDYGEGDVCNECLKEKEVKDEKVFEN